MSEFSINTSKLKAIIPEFNNTSNELKKLCESILTVQKNLAISTSQRDEFIQQLNSIESDLLDEAVKASNLGKALEYIVNKYEKIDQTIIEFGKGKRSIADYFNAKLKDAGLTLLKWLGLDDDYYRFEINYEKYDEARSQEKLMDQYMQAIIANMLKGDKYSEKTWNAASIEKRKDMLGEFIQELDYIMGTGVDTNIIYEEMTNKDGTVSGTRGYFSYPPKTVTINENYLQQSNANSYMIMRTMIHEMRHAYQREAIAEPENFKVSQKTLKHWEDNFNNYKNVEKYGYDAYVSQSVEYDAKSFAEQYQDIKGKTAEYAGSWE